MIYFFCFHLNTYLLSTRHAGIPDVVIHGETGLLVEENDVDGMAKCMVRLLEDNAFARHLGKQAKIRIKDNFSMDLHLKAIETEIKKAVNS